MAAIINRTIPTVWLGNTEFWFVTVEASIIDDALYGLKVFAAQRVVRGEKLVPATWQERRELALDDNTLQALSDMMLDEDELPPWADFEAQDMSTKNGTSDPYCDFDFC